MKYILNTMCKRFANVKKEIVKFFIAVITAMSFTPSFAEDLPSSNPWIYDGEEKNLVLEVEGYEYKLSSDDEWSAASPTAVDAGAYVVEYRLEGTEEGPYESIKTIVSKRTVTLEWSNLSFVYDELSHSPKADFADADEILSKDLENLSIVVSGAKINAGEVDGYQAVATLDGTASINYAILSGDEKKSFTISKADPVVNTLPTAAVGLKENNTTLSLLVGIPDVEGGTLQYSLDGKETYVETATTKTAGVYTIYFKVVGDENHNDLLVDDPVTVTVTKDLNLEMSREGWIYGEEPSAFAGVSGNLGDAEVSYTYYTDEACTKPTTVVANGALAVGEVPTNSGTYYIKAKVPAISFYNKDSVTCSFTISKATLKGDDYTGPTAKTDLKYENKDHELVYGGEKTTINGSFEYALGEGGLYSTALPVGKDAQTYKVYYKFIPTDTNIVASVPDFVTVTIAQVDPVATLPTAVTGLRETGDVLYLLNDDAACTGGTLNYSLDGVDFDPAIPTVTEAGAYVIYFKIIGDSNHKTKLLEDTLHVTVKNAVAELTLSLSREGWTYGEEPSAFVEVSGNTGNGNVSYVYYTDAECSKTTSLTNGGAAGEGLEPKKAGTYYLKATVEATDDYKAGSIVAPFVIAPKEITLVWSGTEFKYDAAVAQKPSATLVDVLDADIVSVIVEGEQTNVGSYYEATAILSGKDAGNYVFAASAKVKTKFNISKSDITSSDFTAPKAIADLKYDGTDLVLVETGKVVKIAGDFLYAVDDEKDLTTTIPSAKDAKTHVVRYQFVPKDNGYNPSDTISIPVAISPAKLTIEWGENVLVYNGKPQVPSVTLKDLVGDDVLEKTVEGAETKVGTGYEAKLTLSGDALKNYTYSAANVTKDFSIILNEISKPTITQTEFTYSGSEITFVESSENYTITGVSSAIEPDTFQVSITPNEGYAWADGTTSSIEKTFVIKKISVEIPDADTRKFEYNGTAQTYSIAENAAYKVTGNVERKAGSYTVVVSLIDKDHYVWSDKKTTDRTYQFNISKSVVKLPKADSVLTYIYDGVVKNFDITIAAGSALADSNSTAVNAGVYYRTVSLNLGMDSSYVWEDKSIEPVKFTFEIKPQPVIIPVVTEKDFIYNGKPFNFVVPEDTAKVARYTVEMESESEVGPGSYTATLKLIDNKNYVWADNSSNDREIVFKIGNGMIDVPTFPTTYTYSGEEIVFLHSTSAYTVENGSGKDVDVYTVILTPTANYTWNNGTKTPVEVKVKIVELPIAKPTLSTTTFTYNGQELFRIPTSDGYELTGDTFGVEPRKYKSTISLNKNYIWKDSTKNVLTFNIEIKKIVIDVPTADSTEYVYNGIEQTYKVVADPICKVINNKQTNAGTYSVKVSLDTLHYVWSDKTEADKSYEFVISKIKVHEPVVSKYSFVYDGTDKNFEIVENENYVIDEYNASASAVGTYNRTVSLIDTTNYSWLDGSVDDIEIKFEITPISVAVPTVSAEYPYTGSPITFIEETKAYKVTNGVKTDAGKYEVIVSLNPGYVWKDGSNSTKDKTFNVEINPLYVSKPDVKDATYDYNGVSHSFGFKPNKGYTLVGDTVATEPGTYVVEVRLNNNYIWNDETNDTLSYTFVISKLDVAIPVAKTTKYSYTGAEQTYSVEIPEDSLFFVSNNVQTNAGKYVVSASLKDTLHYQWSDTTTADKTFDFIINKARVTIPTASLSNIIFDGTEKLFEIPESVLYRVADSNKVATESGTYIRTATLVDTANYVWADETSGVKSIIFTIGDGTIILPDVQLEYDYTGDTIIFVPEDGSYTVVNGAKMEVGEYKVVVTPNKGYSLPGGLKDTVFNVVIKPIMVAKPELQLEYTYNKKTIDFKVPVNVGYEIIGKTSAMELGEYKVTLDLLPNYMWTDSTLGKVEYVFLINKLIVPLPVADTTTFVYNGKHQTYNIEKSSNYNVLGNVQTYAGSYDVSVLLVDFGHSLWADGTTEVKTYTFNIERATVELPKAEQANFVYDGSVKYFNVVENPKYEVISKNSYATDVASYIRTVALKDTLNNTWIDRTVEDKTVTFTITNGVIDVPEVVEEYVYNGSKFTFVPENAAYVVENGTQTNAGSYDVTVKLKSGYLWSDNSDTAKVYKVLIKPLEINKPVFPELNVYTYNDTVHGVVIPESVGYTVAGITQTKEPGKYEVNVTLKPNYIWSDSTVDTLTYVYNINKIVVDIPAKSDSVFTYTGKEITYPVEENPDYYEVYGQYRTTSGLHTVTVALNDTIHYIWADSTSNNRSYEFLINKFVVDYPVAKVDSFVFDETTHSFDVEDSEYYVVDRSIPSATEIGTYTRIVSLADTINFIWPDGTNGDKEIYFYILNGIIPTIQVPTDLVYTGDTLTLIESSTAYTITNNKVVNAGQYDVVITPNEGYSWASDSTSNEKTFTVIVARQSVELPSEDTTVFVYNGMPQIYNIDIPEDSLFTVSGNVNTSVGKYDVVLDLKDTINYCWTDSTIASKTYLFSIDKYLVNIPVNNQGAFLYNGKPQKLNIPISSDSLYVITGNVQTEVGEYDVYVTLKDTVNYCWSDLTVDTQIYKFLIKNSDFSVYPIVQSEDLIWESTPGNVAVLDLKVVGSVYQYWVTCDSFPEFNTDTFDLNGSVSSLDVYIPDTLKPGVYKIKVNLMSGTLVKTQEVTLKVNYPASNIYVVWDDVLTVDNSAGLFNTYQWYKNGEIIPGATKQYYQEKGDLDGYYSCLVNGELYVGPAFFHLERPLWFKTYGGEGFVSIEMVGTIPVGTIINIYSTSGTVVQTDLASRYMTYDLPKGTYIIKLNGTDQSVKVLVK